MNRPVRDGGRIVMPEAEFEQLLERAAGLTAEAVRQVEPAIPLLQSLLQLAPWVVGAAALAGIAYMVWARIDDRRRGLR